MNRFRWIPLLCLLLMLALAACGGEEAPTPEPTATPTTQPAPTDTPIPPTPPTPPTDTPAPAETPAAAAESVLATPRAAVSLLPSPTPAPMLEPDPCDQALTGQDAQLAEQYPVLGCPLAAPELTQMARQSFQNGMMIWREDEQRIYVLHDDGRWRSFEDTFEEGQPESDESITAPDGLYQPIRGFGRIWREQLGGPQAEIGWGTLPEGAANGSTQRWEHGQLISFGLPERFLIFNDGRWTRVE
ncbi:MAG: hypothetical protein KF893_15610 [Caldilineaceae bacterium]|nr:hypothetical protein [Caldilineaceae bacterium]